MGVKTGSSIDNYEKITIFAEYISIMFKILEAHPRNSQTYNIRPDILRSTDNPKMVKYGDIRL